MATEIRRQIFLWNEVAWLGIKPFNAQHGDQLKTAQTPMAQQSFKPGIQYRNASSQATIIPLLASCRFIQTFCSSPLAFIWFSSEVHPRRSSLSHLSMVRLVGVELLSSHHHHHYFEWPLCRFPSLWMFRPILASELSSAWITWPHYRRRLSPNFSPMSVTPY